MRTKVTTLCDGTRYTSEKSSGTSSNESTAVVELLPWDGSGLIKPGCWGHASKAPQKIKDKILDMAYKQAPKSHTHWDDIFQPIMIAAEYMDMLDDIHEIALPIDEQKVKKWNPIATDWILPRFRITKNDMQGTLCKELEGVYRHVVRRQVRNTGTQFQEWSLVQSAWSGCASFFRTFWYANSHLSKAEAFRQAKEIGQAKVTTEKKRLSVQKSFLLAAKTNYHSRRINLLLTSALRMVALAEDDGHATNDYYMFANEDEAQVTLKAFFDVRDIKTGKYKDMIAFSKVWIQSEYTSVEDKDLYQQLLGIYSAREVGAKKKKTKKRPRQMTAPEKIELSKKPITTSRKHQLQQRNNPILLLKVSALWRKANARRKKRPPHRHGFKPIFVLQVYKAGIHTRTQTDVFMWRIPSEGRPEPELLQLLFAGVKDFRAEIPSIEGVDASIDHGRLKKGVFQCQRSISSIQNEPRFKCREVRRLKQLINQAWKLEGLYRRLVESRIAKHCYVCTEVVTDDSAAVCHACARAIHRGCGYCFNEHPINCATCCRAHKKNPPTLSQDGNVLVDGGSKWKKLMLDKYVCIMNFVSTMLTNHSVANTFQEEAVPSLNLRVTQEASQVLIALAMHDPNSMGDKHFIQGLVSWLPPLYHPSFCAYLTIFNKISRAEGEQEKTIKSICSKILLKYYSRGVQDCIKDMLKHVKEGNGKVVVAEDVDVAMALTNLRNPGTIVAVSSN